MCVCVCVCVKESMCACVYVCGGRGWGSVSFLFFLNYVNGYIKSFAHIYSMHRESKPTDRQEAIALVLLEYTHKSFGVHIPKY